MTVPAEASVVWSSGAAASTSMTSVTAPISSVMSSCRVSPMDSVTPLPEYCLKPSDSAMTMYSPIRNGGERKLPVSFDCAVYSVPVAKWAKVTFVPGTTAPVASVTLPTIRAVSAAWPKRGALQSAKTSTVVANRLHKFIGYSLPSC